MADALDTTERKARIAELKRRIAAGQYETPEKIQSAVEAILDDHAAGSLEGGVDNPPRRNRPK